MRYEKRKKNSILFGKSFYFIIVLCLIGIGVGAWVAYDRIQQDNYDPSLESREPVSEIEETIPPTDSEPPLADNVGTEKEDEPYESAPAPEPTPEASPEATNFIMPILGNVAKQFSDSTLVYSETFQDMRLHTGIDIAAKQGDSVKSCGSGTVTAIADDAYLGKYIEIDHGKGITARYCGLDEVSVSEGDTVTAVTLLGTVGEVSGECKDASHIHLEFLKDEIPVDPLSVIYPE